MAKLITTTNRLILREFDPSDAEVFYALNADPEVMKFTDDLSFESIQATRNFIENYDAYTKTGMGRWTLCIKENKKIIGWCGLKKHPDGMVDLGYRILQETWGKGYATEAAKASVTYGFDQLGLTEIVGRTARANTRSIRVLEKINMQFWKNAPCKGIHDSVYYRIRKT